jgi:hypothetical protein
MPTPTWAEKSPKWREPSIWDRRSGAVLAKTKPWRGRPNAETLSHFHFSLPLFSRASNSARAAAERERDGGRRCGAARWPARQRATFTRRWARRRRGKTPTFLGLGFGFVRFLFDLKANWILSFYLLHGLRSRAWALAHGVPTPLTQKSENPRWLLMSLLNLGELWQT